MAAHRKRPLPPERMVELLVEEKRRVIEVQGFVTETDFDRAWETAWAIMVTERAWPHATAHRRAWRRAMEEAMLPEARACFLNQPSGFHKYVGALAEAMDRAMVHSGDMLVGRMVA